MMSEQVLETGRITYITNNLRNFIRDNIDDFSSNYHEVKKQQVADLDETDLLELFHDNCYRTHVYHNGVVYKVTEYKEHDFADLFYVADKGDGEYEFIVSYYNGGCGFSEAVENALDNLEDAE